MNKEEWTTQQDDIGLVDSFNADYAVTFNINRRVTRNEAIRMLHEWQKRLNRKIIDGQHTKDKRDKLNWIHFYEVESGNSHFHSVLKIVSGLKEPFIKHANHEWASVVNTDTTKGQLWIDESPNHAVAVYITKKGDMVTTTA